MTAERRTRDGGVVVPVDDLRVGDQIRFEGGGRVVWAPITAIEELPKTRRVSIGSFFGIAISYKALMRRTTLVARAPRKDER